MWVNWLDKLLVVHEVLSLRLQNISISHNLFYNITVPLRGNNDIAWCF
jgi:hypothetical protein